jgi:hypothetical protein
MRFVNSYKDTFTKPVPSSMCDPGSFRMSPPPWVPQAAIAGPDPDGPDPDR